MMKISLTKIGLFLGVLTICLTSTAYADSITMTIQAINADGVIASITLTDTGGLNGDFGGYSISEFAGIGASFAGTLPGTDFYTTSSAGFVENPSNGLGPSPLESILTLSVTNAGCNSNCNNTHIVISLTDNGATVPPPPAALANATLFGSGAVTSGSSVSVQSTIVDSTTNTQFVALSTPPGTAPGLGAVGQGTVVLTGPYSITSTADITFTTASVTDGASAGNFDLVTDLNGCTDATTDPTCAGNTPFIGEQVPEPASLLLVGSSLLGLGVLRRKHSRTL